MGMLSSHYFFALVQHVAPLCLQWLLAQLFPAAWTGSMAVWASAQSIFIRCLCKNQTKLKNQETLPEGERSVQQNF
jgi:hypothetical protein